MVCVLHVYRASRNHIGGGSAARFRFLGPRLLGRVNEQVNLFVDGARANGSYSYAKAVMGMLSFGGHSR